MMKNNSRMLVAVLIIVILIVVAAVAFLYTPQISGGTKNFSYTTSVSEENPPSFDVTDVNGPIRVLTWSRDYLLINGSVVANGVGSSPNDISLVFQNTSNAISFNAKFPNGTTNFLFFFSNSYNVEINVYVPNSARFTNAHFITVNGEVRVLGLDASNAEFNTVNGEVNFTSISSMELSATTVNGAVRGSLLKVSEGGSYSLSSVNGAISLSVPKDSAGFKLSESVVVGSVQASGFANTNLTQTSHSISGTVGDGSATITLNTVNGSVEIKGT